MARTMEEFKAGMQKFCHEHKISELMDTLCSRNPVVLSEAMSPIDGFQALADNDLRACPVRIVGGNEIVGTLDLRDICKFVVEEGSKKQEEEVAKKETLPPMAEEKELDTSAADLSGLAVNESAALTSTRPRTPTSRKNAVLESITKHPFMTENTASLRYLAKMRPFKCFPPETTLYTVAEALAHGSHIVGISGSSNAETAGLSMVVSQKQLFQALIPFLKTVELPVVDFMCTPVLTVTSQSHVLEAFSIIANKGISGLAVVDEDGKIVHNTSSQDIKIPELMGERALGQMWVGGGEETPEGKKQIEDVSTIEIEDFLVKVRASRPALKDRHPVCSAHKDDTVGHVASMLEKTGYHHVWIVEDRVPVGVISFTDLFRKSL